MEPDDLIGRLDGAFERRASGDFSAALETFEALEQASEQPQDISALRLFQTYCLLDIGRNTEALVRIESIEAKYLGVPLRANFEYQFARILHSLGRAEDAIRHAENAQRIFDSLTEGVADANSAKNARTLLGVLLTDSNRCAEAIPLLKAVGIRDEGWDDVRLRLGNCYLAQKKYDEAIGCYLTIISPDLKADPVIITDALRNIGCAYYWLGQYAKSVSYLTRVRRAYEGRPELEEQVSNFLAAASSRLNSEKN